MSSLTATAAKIIDSVLIRLASALPISVSHCDATFVPAPVPQIASLVGKAKTGAASTPAGGPSSKDDGLDGAYVFVQDFIAHETLEGSIEDADDHAAIVGARVLREEKEAGGWWAYFRSLYNSSLRLLRLLGRVLYCSTIVSSALAVAPVLLMFNKSEALWSYVVKCIEMLGPTYVKLAQWASSRPDLFS
jgi:hypothetical protein